MITEQWAAVFHVLHEDQQEKLWDILLDEEKEIVNKYKHYKNLNDSIKRK
ncbi:MULTISPECIES: hypothetical protein [Oceanobacillus]|nr:MULTISPECIES: hypothetical protein [Oceanobacillus]